MADAADPADPAGAAVLRTLETGHGTDDLAPLRDVLGRARVVGLGEAVTGTREMALLAGRVLELLVDEMGVRVLALDAAEAPVVALDEYVTGERSSVSDALEVLADWRWNTADVVRILDWVAARNAAAGDDPVRVVGVDPVTAAPAVTALGTFLRVHDPALLDEVGDPILKLLPHRPGRPPLRAETRAAANSVAARIEVGAEGVEGVDGLEGSEGSDGAEGSEGADGSGADPSPTLRRHADALVRAARLATTPLAYVDAERERLVADRVRELADGGERVLWWSRAHSVRVRSGSAGELLREEYGSAYYALGVLLGAGEFRATRRRRVLRTSRTPTRQKMKPAPHGTLEAALAGDGVRVLDLADGALPAGATSMRALPDPLPLRWRRVREPVADGELDGVAVVARSREALLR